MANFYALPGLTSWIQMDGWSSTSGGASNGISEPTQNDNVIFDANSGSARGVALPSATAPQCSNFNSAGSAAITFTGTSQLMVWNGGNFSGVVSMPGLRLGYGTFTFGNCLTGYTTVGDGVYPTIASDMNTGGQPFQFLGGIASTTTINAGVTISFGNFSGNTTNSIVLGAGVTFVCSGNSMYCGDTSLWSGAMSSATLKFTNGSGLNVSLLSFSLAAFGTVWNALTGGSVLQVNNTSFYNSAVNYKAGPGSITSITSGSGLIATGIDVDGLGGPVAVIRSSSAGSQATITKVGGGALTLNYCSLKDISGNTAAYGGTYAARNSVDLGNNTNITFAKQPSGFMAFF